MTGPSESADGLTQLKPGRVAVAVGESVEVGNGVGDPLSFVVGDGVGDVLPVVVGVMLSLPCK